MTHVVQFVVLITGNTFTFYFASGTIILGSKVELEGVTVVIFNSLGTGLHGAVIRTTEIIHSLADYRRIKGLNNAYKVRNHCTFFVEEVVFGINFLLGEIKLITLVHCSIA